MNEKTAVFLEYRRLLFTLAYNILADVAAAELLLGEIHLRWLEREAGDERQTKAYLVQQVVRGCIEQPGKGVVSGTPFVAGPYFSLSAGVMELLAQLGPMERALFVLREVFAYDYGEISAALGHPAQVCRDWYRQVVERLGGEAAIFRAEVSVHEKILHRFMRTLLEKDAAALGGCLYEDVLLLTDGRRGSMVVGGNGLMLVPEPIRGRHAVCGFILNTLDQFISGLPFFHWEMAIANGMPAIISYVGKTPVCLSSFETDGEQITNIYVQVKPDTLRKIRGG